MKRARPKRDARPVDAAGLWKTLRVSHSPWIRFADPQRPQEQLLLLSSHHTSIALTGVHGIMGASCSGDSSAILAATLGRIASSWRYAE